VLEYLQPSLNSAQAVARAVSGASWLVGACPQPVLSRASPVLFHFHFISATVLAFALAPSRTNLYCLRRSLVAALYHFQTGIGIIGCARDKAPTYKMRAAVFSVLCLLSSVFCPLGSHPAQYRHYQYCACHIRCWRGCHHRQ
jgi:hypothetical protein